jgi:hypothetical protein
LEIPYRATLFPDATAHPIKTFSLARDRPASAMFGSDFASAFDIISVNQTENRLNSTTLIAAASRFDAFD